MFCDLHTHSVFSDGTCTPTEILDQALASGLSAIALTDHNTVDGMNEFISASKGKNIEIVSGAEFSVNHNGKELHILGLFITPEHFDQVSRIAAIINEQKEESNIALINSLNRVGFQLDYEEIKRSTPNGKINRAHIATAMVKKGYVSSVNEGMNTYLSDSAGHYKEPKRFPAKEIIDFIRSIGAVSVLAHPFMNLNESELIEFLSLEYGLCGMECYYSEYDEATINKSLQIAKRFNLIASGGSDFHGTTKPSISLGTGKGSLRIPYECYLELKEKHAAINAI